MRSERGFALIAVLLVMAMVGALGAEFAYSMRLEASSVRAYKDALVAGHLAEAGVEQAIREIVGDVGFAVLAEDGDLTFYRNDRAPINRLPRSNVPLGVGAFSYRIGDEEARINLNTASPDRVDVMLRALEVDKSVRDTINDSLQDWRDANEDHRLNGAESEDTYLRLAVPYRSKNGNLDSVTELLQVHGVTRAIYDGADGRPGLADIVTVRTPGQVNINTASPVVLRALGFAEAEISEVLETRKAAPYQNVGRFGGRGLAATTRTFRIVATGLIDGQVRARVTAIVQRRADNAGDNVAVLEWSGVR